MTNTLKLATEVWQTSRWTSEQLKRLERFAELVAEQERDACAKVCEKAVADIWKYHDDGRTEIGQTVCINLARAIRAKEQTP
jgi:hypothetical protein